MRVRTAALQTSRYQEWLVLGVCFFVILLSERVGWLQYPEVWLQQRILPVRELLGNSALFVHTPFTRVVTGFDDATRVDQLEVEYARVLAQLHELERLEKENQQLRTLLETRETQQTTQRVIASVISYSTPTIAAGSKAGVGTGALVFSAGTLLGQVRSVSEFQSQVSLLRSASGPAMVVQTESGVQGVLVGDGKRVLMQEVPRNRVVEVGQRVVTVGQEGVQSGLLVGVIAQVRAEPTAPTQEIVVDQLVSFYETTVVEVW